MVFNNFLHFILQALEQEAKTEKATMPSGAAETEEGMPIPSPCREPRKCRVTNQSVVCNKERSMK